MADVDERSEYNFNEFPCPFFQCTYEKYPKIISASDRMMELLDISRESPTWQEFLQDNLYFMIPFEERGYVRKNIDYVGRNKQAVKVEHHIQKSDGTLINVAAWISPGPSMTLENVEATTLYVAFIPTGCGHISAIEENNASCFHALESAYEIIFEIDIAQGTVECIHGRDTSAIGSIGDVRMTIPSARSFWLNNYIVEADRQKMNDYFALLLTPGAIANDQLPMRTEFHVTWTDNVVHSFLSVAVQSTNSTILLCLRNTTEHYPAAIAEREKHGLLQAFQHLQDVQSGNAHINGLVSFSEVDEWLNFSYISAPVKRRMNLSDNAYLTLLTEGLSLESYLELVGVTLEQHREILSGQPCEISLVGDDGKPFTIRPAVTSYEEDGKQIYNVFLVDDVIVQSKSVPGKGVFVRAFGYFDMFVDGVPVTFSSPKEKELLALLIDRNGGTLTTNEAITFLWEDEPCDKRLKARYRRLALNLKNTLISYGVQDIVINNHGTRSIDTSLVTCDYYEYLAGNPEYRNAFRNAYMSGYSWGETTLGSLWV